MFINERMRAIASEQLEAINGITDQLECLTHEMMTLRKIYEARGN